MGGSVCLWLSTAGAAQACWLLAGFLAGWHGGWGAGHSLGRAGPHNGGWTWLASRSRDCPFPAGVWAGRGKWGHPGCAGGSAQLLCWKYRDIPGSLEPSMGQQP